VIPKDSEDGKIYDWTEIEEVAMIADEYLLMTG